MTIRRQRDLEARAASASSAWLTERTIIARTARCEIMALSPSQATIALAFQEISELLPKEGPKRNLVAQQANSVAVVLSVRCHGTGPYLLLGSDLEVTKAPNTGWHAVVSAARGLSVGQSVVYKVAHHGSETGYDARVWQALVHSDAHCVMTPFQASRLPTTTDRARIRSHSPNVYVTSSDAGVRPPRRELNEVINAAARSRRQIGTRMGHVRLRIPPGAVTPADVHVEMFGAATKG
jgi:hypothetical protein